jgi:hypothetical protein
MGFTIAPSPFRNRRAEASADLITDNGQIERINRTIMDTTVKRYHTIPAVGSFGASTISSPPTPSPKAQDPQRHNAL